MSHLNFFNAREPSLPLQYTPFTAQTCSFHRVQACHPPSTQGGSQQWWSALCAVQPAQFSPRLGRGSRGELLVAGANGMYEKDKMEDGYGI